MNNCYVPARLKETEFEIIRRVVYEQTGIKLTSQKRVMVESRLNKRLKQIGCPDFGQYVKTTRLNPKERAIMLNLITTNVTKFFRENHHFDFINDYLPQYLNQDNPHKTLRVWSAGCSSGQEPYSIAIVLNEFYEKHPGDFRILASDINTEVLQLAVQGIYKSEEVDEIPYPLLTKYFKLGSGSNKGLFKVKDNLQQKISFRQINLADGNLEFPVDGFLDFIFCRNVFIYFDQETKKLAIRKFYKKLYNGGCLFLGHSETLNAYDGPLGTWIPKEHTVYMKKEGAGGNEQNQSAYC